MSDGLDTQHGAGGNGGGAIQHGSIDPNAEQYLLPNQPITFIGNEENNCQCGESVYQQVYFDSDLFNFQFKSFPVEEIEFVVDFVDGNFTDSSYGICGTSGGTGNMDSTNILAIDDHFRITIIATGITQGSVDVSFGSVLVGTIDHDGEYIFSGRCQGAPTVIFQKDIDFDGCLNVELLERLCDEWYLEMYDRDGNLVEEITDGFFQFGMSVGFSLVVSELSKEFVLGCYSFCLKSGCNAAEEITNGTFNTNLNGWTIEGNGFSWDSQKAKYVFNGQPESGLVQSALTIGVCYIFSVTFSPNDGAANGEWEIRNGGAVLYNHVFVTPTTTTVTVAFTATSTDFGVFAISTATGNIDDVSVKTQPECSPSIGCTTLINFIPANTDCRYKLLQWTNNESAFGFDFESSGFTTFYFYLRVEAQFKKPKYPEESEPPFIDSAGADKLLYFKGRKSKILAIGSRNTAGVSEAIHDAIFLARRHDTFLVDGIDYVVLTGEYAPQWQDASDLAPSEIELTKRTQLFENSYCSS